MTSIPEDTLDPKYVAEVERLMLEEDEAARTGKLKPSTLLEDHGYTLVVTSVVPLKDQK